jgi:uncharacterized protein (TIGR03086 family)
MPSNTDARTAVIDLTPACDRMVELIAAVDDAQLTLPTPCAEYSVADLIDHVAQVARGATALARGEEEGMNLPGTGPDATHPDLGWRDRITVHLRELGEAWQDPAAWEGIGDDAPLGMSNEIWGRIAFTEVVVHGWDLAVAIDQPFELPEATLQACWDHVAEFVPQAPLPDLWGPPVAVDGDAPLLDRIVALTGRTPRP